MDLSVIALIGAMAVFADGRMLAMASPSPSSELQPPGRPGSSASGNGNGNGNGTGTVNARVRTAIALVITAVWAGSFVADIVVPDYTPSPFLHMIMIGLAAAVFGSNFVKGVVR